jgi:molybdopterin-containing oxidoreductase family iron-sulfur binding subunit
MPSLTDTNGARYWRSLDELARTPEFREAVRREFPDDEWDRLPLATRRQFLRVMGASLGLAGLTACRWPKEEIVPFAHRPEERVPGVPQQFATSLEMAGAALGVLVTSYDGRPIKVEGNPEHPDSLGAATAVAQASILGLYDPDRSAPRSRGGVRQGLGRVRERRGPAIRRAWRRDRSAVRGVIVAQPARHERAPPGDHAGRPLVRVRADLA